MSQIILPHAFTDDEFTLCRLALSVLAVSGGGAFTITGIPAEAMDGTLTFDPLPDDGFAVGFVPGALPRAADHPDTLALAIVTLMAGGRFTVTGRDLATLPDGSLLRVFQSEAPVYRYIAHRSDAA